jgi:hypothetical protein
METSSLYLGTTIAFNKEDGAKHGKHIITSMKENILAIGKSRLNLTQKLRAIKTFELPRIDFRMMCGDLYQSDLREFDSWLRGQVMGWLKIPGIATEVFLMSWRDGGFTLPSLEERQYTMIIRTLLDVMSTMDQELLKIMRMFEKEEAQRYGCEVVDRNKDAGGFMRWEGTLPDVRTKAGPPLDDRFHTPALGEKELPKLLRDDLSIFPLALRACQELGLAIWMTDVTPRLRQKDLGIDFTSSKISRPATWITQEVVRKLALNSFKTSIQCSKGWREIENSPSSNHWLKWATSRYDDALLRFAVGARLYTLSTPGRLKKLHTDSVCDIPCRMCGKVKNPDLFHILSECKHGGPTTMLDIHNRVACAVRKAIEIGNPQAKIAEDKTVL